VFVCVCVCVCVSQICMMLRSYDLILLYPFCSGPQLLEANHQNADHDQLVLEYLKHGVPPTAD